MQNITNGKTFSIPWIIHEYTEQGTNGDFLLVSKLRLKTTPTFALEKQTRLVRKQTRFILTLPVAGAVDTNTRKEIGAGKPYLVNANTYLIVHMARSTVMAPGVEKHVQPTLQKGFTCQLG